MTEAIATDHKLAVETWLGPTVSMAARLHVPAERDVHTVLVLIPGSTYNGSYWDFPYEPDTYNFRAAMNREGYATLVLDRVGTGRSSRPYGLLVTATLQARGVHRAIAALRRGELGARTFTKVVTVGHSEGSAVAVLEAGAYRDVDGVVLTGFSHAMNWSRLTDVLLTSYRRPACWDPKFRGRGYDPTYFTTVPGTRGPQFYDPLTSDPAVVAEDESSKDVVTPFELAGGIGRAVMLGVSARIDIPVLNINGTSDRFFCNPRNSSSDAAYYASEASRYVSSPCFEAELIPDVGHGINLSTLAPGYHHRVACWVHDRIDTKR